MDKNAFLVTYYFLYQLEEKLKLTQETNDNLEKQIHQTQHNRLHDNQPIQENKRHSKDNLLELQKQIAELQDELEQVRVKCFIVCCCIIVLIICRICCCLVAN